MTKPLLLLTTIASFAFSSALWAQDSTATDATEAPNLS